ncbi:sugar ABC transporter ATP-binding protein [Rubrimonas cliftonensis]|uniref:Monosaccharide ABC transporter ATP-binding protein, CUT2 family n=1 Tax=Rubrimonas cliftonensis TaxID=89524 RepID=A0A1H3XHS9_9RHOB|nr:sugar ABC transporter ATP-binding protein [Rubrimonas cliftonensis]SDZ98182.1 monosaccharide ABC transporter ATP-binding protein, CUT2 family [Rubrimonas cliftonensis]
MNLEQAGGGATAPLLELRGAGKSFGGVTALEGVDFDLRAGEIHGLVGENGAGKSTTMKIIAGVHHDYRGEMLVGGRPARFRSPGEALAAGVGMVHQELSVAPELTVAENVFLGAQPVTRLGLVDWSRMNREARGLITSLGLDLDPRARMGDLPVGLQQMVELARVLFSGARILILDEPTSALSPPEVERLFTVLRRLRGEGRGLIFISHFLDDVLAISDRVTVFRNGRRVTTEPVAGLTKDAVIGHMIGRRSAELHMGETAELRGDDARPVAMSLRAPGLDIDLRAGEITGVYGFMGCGQIELARALFGKGRIRGARIEIDGRPVSLRSTAAARAAGVAYVPENRRMMLFREAPVYKNVSIAILDRIHRVWLRPKAERRIAQTHIADLQIRPPQAGIAVGSLSGGNQQKVALAKWLTHLPKVLILSEPTRGMDVGAKEDVIRILRSLRDRGVAVLVLSTEPETILTLAERVLVMRKGAATLSLSRGRIDKSHLLAAA